MGSGDCQFDSNFGREPSAYNALLILAGAAVATYGLARFFESNNTLAFDSRPTRILCGLIKVILEVFHTRSDDLTIINADGEAKLMTVGPHRTGWEAMVLAAKIKGTPPRFFATDSFNAIPGVASFMTRFNVITIEALAKGQPGKTANSRALDKASQALQEHGCVALFPQGGFSKIGEEPRRVYDGAAKLAIRNNTPIHVVRLDGYWSLENPIIPVFMRNNRYYRAFLSAFHLNNVRATACGVIDLHLKPDNQGLTDEQKIEEINARLYAYYRCTEELSVEQIHSIDADISEGKHIPVWKAKVEHDQQEKALCSVASRS